MNTPLFDGMIPIETTDGGSVTDFVSVARWQSALREKGDPEQIDVADFLAEQHHHYYGKPWIAGRYYFDALLGLGLKPTDRVLDVGCGAGRLGVWLIPYLQAGGYYGVDSHLKSLVAFSAYECRLHSLVGQAPRLLLDADFRLGHFGVLFDVILDFSVTHLLDEARREQAWERIAAVAAPDARIFSIQNSGLPANIASLGLELVAEHEISHPLFARKTVTKIGGPERGTLWRELRRRP